MHPIKTLNINSHHINQPSDDHLSIPTSVLSGWYIHYHPPPPCFHHITVVYIHFAVSVTIPWSTWSASQDWPNTMSHVMLHINLTTFWVLQPVSLYTGGGTFHIPPSPTAVNTNQKSVNTSTHATSGNNQTSLWVPQLGYSHVGTFCAFFPHLHYHQHIWLSAASCQDQLPQHVHRNCWPSH